MAEEREREGREQEQRSQERGAVVEQSGYVNKQNSIKNNSVIII